MESGVTVRSFNKRATRRSSGKQPYSNMAAQTKAHVSAITSEREALLTRALPYVVRQYYTETNYLEQCKKQTAYEWNRLVNSAEFRRTANIEWLTDFNEFVKDLGEAPSPQHVIIKQRQYIKFTKHTCEWGFK